MIIRNESNKKWKKRRIYIKCVADYNIENLYLLGISGRPATVKSIPDPARSNQTFLHMNLRYIYAHAVRTYSARTPHTAGAHNLTAPDTASYTLKHGQGPGQSRTLLRTL